MSDGEVSIALVGVVVVALVLFALQARSVAPTYQPSASAPIAPPEPGLPKKCGYWTTPSAITGVTQRAYVCCHPRSSSAAQGTAAGGAIGAKVGGFIPVPILGSVVGNIVGQGIGSIFGPPPCLDTDADRANAVAMGWS